jgi:MFS transporter, DHA1 family, inner membrane transport protein
VKAGNGEGNSATSLLAVSLAGSNYFLFVSLQPILFGALVAEGHISLSAASAVLSANLLGAIVGNLAALFKVSLLHTRQLISAGAALLTITQVLFALLPLTMPAMWILMFGAGAGAGALGGAASATVVAMNRPNRVFAMILAAQILTGAAAIYAAPSVIESFGLRGLFLGMAAAASISIVTSPWTARLSSAREVTPSHQEPFAMRQALVLVSLAILYVANNAAWAYLELVAKNAGLVTEQAGHALAFGQGASLLGAIAAGLWNRSRPRMGLAIGVTLMAAAIGMFTGIHGVTAMTMVTAVFMGALCFAVPLYMGTLAMLDSSGRSLVLAQVAIGVGLVVGPLVAAMLVEHSSLQIMLWISAAAALGSLALVLIALRSRLTYI